MANPTVVDVARRREAPSRSVHADPALEQPSKGIGHFIAEHAAQLGVVAQRQITSEARQSDLIGDDLGSIDQRGPAFRFRFVAVGGAVGRAAEGRHAQGLPARGDVRRSDNRIQLKV